MTRAIPSAAHTVSTAAGSPPPAPRKYAAERSSVTPAPGGVNCPRPPHGAGIISGADDHADSAAATTKNTNPPVRPSVPALAPSPSTVPATASASSVRTPAAARYEPGSTSRP